MSSCNRSDYPHEKSVPFVPINGTLFSRADAEQILIDHKKRYNTKLQVNKNILDNMTKDELVGDAIHLLEAQIEDGKNAEETLKKLLEWEQS